jgi:hypothetical protein
VPFRTDPYEVTPDLRDLFLYSGKHRPELYLDPRIRAGISTFAALAEPAEVRSGCARLEADIRSGRIADITTAYRHDRGDYLFIIAEREGRGASGMGPARPSPLVNRRTARR